MSNCFQVIYKSTAIPLNPIEKFQTNLKKEAVKKHPKNVFKVLNCSFIRVTEYIYSYDLGKLVPSMEKQLQSDINAKRLLIKY